MDEEVLNDLVQNACFSADRVAMNFKGTEAEKTKAVIHRALEALEANGLIEIRPASEWPMLYSPHPPYKNPLEGMKGI